MRMKEVSFFGWTCKCGKKFGYLRVSTHLKMSSYQKIFLLTTLALFSTFLSLGQSKSSPLKVVTEKLEKKNYVGLTLQLLYNSLKNQIKEVVWSDEPPAKLSSVFLEIKNSDAFIDIELKVIPESARFNINLNWTLRSVGRSQIESIRLMKGDSVIYRRSK
jgi:hypothetical protein